MSFESLSLSSNTCLKIASLSFVTHIISDSIQVHKLTYFHPKLIFEANSGTPPSIDHSDTTYGATDSIFREHRHKTHKLPWFTLLQTHVDFFIFLIFPSFSNIDP